MVAIKVKPKLQVNPDDIQLIKSGLRKKQLSPADILMSNLTVTNFMINALIDKMSASEEPFFKTNNGHYLYLLPKEISLETVQTLENNVLNGLHVHKNCFTPRTHKATKIIRYNQENNNFEFTFCNTQGEIIKSTIVEINDIVNDFVEAYIKGSVSCIVVKSNQNYLPLRYLLICDKQTEIDILNQKFNQDKE